MPIYEYFCPSCKSKFELLRSMNGINEDAFCPLCNTIGQKLFSVFTSLSKDSEGVSIPAGGFDKCAGCTQSTCSSCI